MQESEILTNLKSIVTSIVTWMHETREPYFGATFLSLTVAVGVTAFITELFTRGSGDGGEDD